MGMSLIYCFSVLASCNFHFSWKCTPIDFIIFNEPCISSFDNSHTTIRTIKHIPLWFFWITNEIFTGCSCIQFSFLRIINPYFCLATPNMLVLYTRCPICPQFKGIFGIALLGTLFNKYMAVFKAYIHKDTGKVEFLNILIIISIKVILCLSETPFYCGVLGIIIVQKCHISEGV